MIRTVFALSAASLALSPMMALAQDKGGKPVVSSSEQEVVNTRTLNQQQADAARAQQQANIASSQNYQARVDDFQAQSAAVASANAAYEAEMAANRQARADYEAAYARWQADVAACTAGDYSRCQSTAPAPK